MTFAGAPMRLSTPRELFLTLKWNLWIFCQAVLIGDPGLDPDQEGSRWIISRRDGLTVVLLPALCFCFYFSGFLPFFVWLCSPWVISAMCELGGETHPTGRVYKGPRIWLPRWYIGTLGIVLMVAGLPAWLRWPIVLCWALESFNVANAYGSDTLFFETVKRQNPNRNHYRIANLAFCLLRDGKHYQAEMEYLDVLRRDPLNFRAGLVRECFKRNRAWTEAGIGYVGFVCSHCNSQSARLLKHGDKLTAQEHAMFFLGQCAFCGHATVPFF